MLPFSWHRSAGAECGSPASHGLLSAATERKLALGFLDFDRAALDHSHIFLENAQQALHLPPDQQLTAALLDLNYYLPCRVQDGAATRTIAVIGLGRTIGGDFLSSEDVELLESLASYIGIALQNASLYSRLQDKITEFERLKEFNENIVESINVGILALDLEGSHRELERADGSDVRGKPRRGDWREAQLGFPGRICFRD